MAGCDLTQDCSVLKLNLKGHKKPITGISFDPDGKQFASSSEDKSIMIWNMQQNIRSYSFSGHSDIVTGIEYSPNGKLLASCSQDQMVRIWVPTILGTSTEFRAHTSAVRTIAFSPDSDKIITGSNEKSIKLWKVGKKQFISSFVGHNNWVRSVQFSQDGKIIALCSDDGTVRIWDTNSGENVLTFRTSKGGPTCLSLHKSGTVVAVSMSSGSLRIYDIRNQKLQQHYVLHDHSTSVCWHPSANYLLSSGKDGKIIVVDVMEGRPLYTIGGHTGAVTCARFNKEGDYFASGGTDQLIMLSSHWHIIHCQSCSMMHCCRAQSPPTMVSFACYLVAVLDNHVHEFLPLISDTGTSPPESCIFGQMLNIGAVLLLITMYIRFRTVQLIRHQGSSQNYKIWNKSSNIFGALSCFGMSLVANFQETSEIRVHLIGAVLTFAIGAVYCIIHAYLTWLSYSNKFLKYIRIFLSALILPFYVISMIFSILSFKNLGRNNVRQWNDKGTEYGLHLAATFTEWITAIIMILFMATFYKEFKLVKFEEISFSL